MMSAKGNSPRMGSSVKASLRSEISAMASIAKRSGPADTYPIAVKTRTGSTGAYLLGAARLGRGTR